MRVPAPHTLSPLSLQSVAAVGISGRNQNTLLHVLLLPPPVNPIAIRNIRANHFANVTRPQFCCVCGWKGNEEGGGERDLLAALVPTCSIFHSNLFSCACIFSLRVASAHPCISFWLARFVWFNYRLTAATPPSPSPPFYSVESL